MISRKHRKAASVALVAVALVGVRAAAAAGVPGGEELFVGSESADACGSSSIDIDYDVAYDAALQAYGISAARLSGLDERCQGYEVIVSLSGPGGAQLAEVTAVVDGSQMRVEMPASAPVSAEQLTGVSVALRSPEV